MDYDIQHNNLHVNVQIIIFVEQVTEFIQYSTILPGRIVWFVEI